MNVATGLKRELEAKLLTIGHRLNASDKTIEEMKDLISQRKQLQAAVGFLVSREPITEENCDHEVVSPGHTRIVRIDPPHCQGRMSGEMACFEI